MTYNHREAFCLMKYATEDGSEVEWLWNSRDGVTPFCVMSNSGKPMQHVQWEYDIKIPNYQPYPTERVFVDATEALLRPKAEEMIRRQQPNLGGQNLADAIRLTVKAWLVRPGTPMTISGEQYATLFGNRGPIVDDKPNALRDAIERARVAYSEKAKGCLDKG